MQSRSSVTMSAPVPSNEPASAIDSKSSPTSRCSSVRNEVEEPPGVHAFRRLPSRTPPAISSITARAGVPIGASKLPGTFTFPETEKTFVPGDFSVPMLANQFAPFTRMCGTLHSVSTLLMAVGLAYRPSTAGNGGRSRGCPRWPSSEDRRAVSSPQM